MSNIEKLKIHLRNEGEIIEVDSNNVSDIDGFYVYMIYNGKSIAQIGHGSGDRLCKCIRGTLAKKHNKAFICALTEVITGNLNKYAYIKLKSKAEAIKVEKNIHEIMGIRTNKDGATIIENVTSTEIEGIHKELWELVKLKPIYINFSEIEKQMAEELFEIVTFATIKVRRSSGKITKSKQGDNLEGNILMNIKKAYLIHIYQKLTNNYHKYGVHKLNDNEFDKILEKYSYVPHRKPFEIISD